MREDIRVPHEVSITVKCDRCGMELTTHSIYDDMQDEIIVGVDLTHECDDDDISDHPLYGRPV